MDRAGVEKSLAMAMAMAMTAVASSSSSSWSDSSLQQDSVDGGVEEAAISHRLNPPTRIVVGAMPMVLVSAVVVVVVVVLVVAFAESIPRPCVVRE